VGPRFLGRIDWLEHGPSRDILCIYNRPSNTRISRSFWRVLEIGMEERRDGSTLLLSPVQLTICEHIAIITSDVRTKLEHSSAPTHGQPQDSDMDRFNKSHPPQLHNDKFKSHSCTTTFVPTRCPKSFWSVWAHGTSVAEKY
jgi:hypothetical protein